MQPSFRRTPISRSVGCAPAVTLDADQSVSTSAVPVDAFNSMMTWMTPGSWMLGRHAKPSSLHIRSMTAFSSRTDPVSDLRPSLFAYSMSRVRENRLHGSEGGVAMSHSDPCHDAR